MLRLKLLLRKLWIKQLDSVNGEFILTFAENPEIDLTRLTRLIAAEPKRLRLTPEYRLFFKSHSPNVVESITELKKKTSKFKLITLYTKLCKSFLSSVMDSTTLGE